VRSEAALNDWIENTLSPQLIGNPGRYLGGGRGGMVREKSRVIV